MQICERAYRHRSLLRSSLSQVRLARRYGWEALLFQVLQKLLDHQRRLQRLVKDLRRNPITDHTL